MIKNGDSESVFGKVSTGGLAVGVGQRGIGPILERVKKCMSSHLDPTRLGNFSRTQ